MTPNLRNASQLGPGDDACPPAAFPQRERTGAGACSFPETPQQVHLRLRSAPPTPQATLPCRCRAEATAQPQASLPAGLALSRTFGPLLPRCTAATFLGPSQRLKGNLSLADSRKRPRQSLHGAGRFGKDCLPRQDRPPPLRPRAGPRGPPRPLSWRSPPSPRPCYPAWPGASPAAGPPAPRSLRAPARSPHLR